MNYALLVEEVLKRLKYTQMKKLKKRQYPINSDHYAFLTVLMEKARRVITDAYTENKWLCVVLDNGRVVKYKQ